MYKTFGGREIGAIVDVVAMFSMIDPRASQLVSWKQVTGPVQGMAD
jgi:hypothetical protein